MKRGGLSTGGSSPLLEIRPYGTWPSPIDADLIVADTLTLGQFQAHDGWIYWTEGRPAEAGRSALMRARPGAAPEEVLPTGFNVRTRVWEYGGGAFRAADDALVFAHFSDHRVYHCRGTEAPRPVTPEGDWRYADFRFLPDGRVVCVREDHSGGGEAVHSLVLLDPEHPGPGQVLASGADFYASPRPTAGGTALAWLQWDHPNMPWDGTELRTATLDADGSLGDARYVAGGVSEAILQPEWSPAGELFFASDRSGWWNLYAWNGEDIRPVCLGAVEMGVPQWVLGGSTYAFGSPGELFTLCGRNEQWTILRVDTDTCETNPVTIPFTHLRDLEWSEGRLVTQAASGSAEPQLITINPADGTWESVRRASSTRVDDRFISIPQLLEFPTSGGHTTHAFYYAPRNPRCAAPEGELPPLVVHVHGGPTSTARPVLSLHTQYWTSRGIAFVDVNYGGSAGYGRAYRERLNGNWGVTDVEDCVHAARYLAALGLADPERTVIAGGSAGGYTTLCAMAFTDVFRAGASHFGLSDLSVFVNDTHKFESRYLDRLVGPWPERRDLYQARSALAHAERITRPIIFFQGLDDRIVPPNQAERLVDVMRRRGIPVAYLGFEGEQHGFRMAASIRRVLQAELYFYGRVLGFQPADEIEPVEISNLEPAEVSDELRA